MKFVKFCKKEKVWSGLKHQPTYNPNVSLGYLILNEFKKTPERITQVSADTGVQVTCFEMRQRSIKIVKHLQSLDLKQGDVVGIMGVNSEHLAAVVFACFTLGLPINSLAPIMVEGDIIHMYSKTKPKVIFCDSDVVETVQSSVNKIACIKPLIYTFLEKVEGYGFVDDILSVKDDGEEFTFPELEDIGNSIAVITCSSGTTGLPKGVCSSHSHLIHHNFALWDINNDKQEVLFNFSTIYWATGIEYLITGSLYGGLRVITTRGFQPQLMHEICTRFGVTTALAGPYAVSLILREENMKPFETVKGFTIVGGFVSESMGRSMQKLLPNGKVWPCYGCSEGGFISDSFRVGRFGSCGVPSQDVQVKIVDDDGKNLGPNQHGEICIKSKMPFLGYFGEPEETARTVVDGWIQLGDIGHFDDDGFIYVLSRKKEMLRYNGFQVYPTELEMIIDSIEGVKNSCVVGVFNEKTVNDLVFAFVVKEADAKNLTASEIENYVNEKVIDHKKLRGGVHFVDALPLTASGKILRRKAKEMAIEIMHSKTLAMQSSF